MYKYLLLILVITSCNPVKKALKVAKENPEDFAAFCADAFPVKDTVITRDSITFDTLYIEGETITEIKTVNDTIYKTITVPGTTRFINRVERRDSIIIRRDIAKETALQKQVNDLIVVNKDYVGKVAKFKKERNIWMWIAIGLGVYNILRLIVKIWGSKINISSLFKK